MADRQNVKFDHSTAITTNDLSFRDFADDYVALINDDAALEFKRDLTPESLNSQKTATRNIMIWVINNCVRPGKLLACDRRTHYTNNKEFKAVYNTFELNYSRPLVELCDVRDLKQVKSRDVVLVDGANFVEGVRGIQNFSDKKAENQTDEDYCIEFLSSMHDKTFIIVNNANRTQRDFGLIWVTDNVIEFNLNIAPDLTPREYDDYILIGLQYILVKICRFEENHVCVLSEDKYSWYVPATADNEKLYLQLNKFGLQTKSIITRVIPRATNIRGAPGGRRFYRQSFIREQQQGPYYKSSNLPVSPKK